MKKLEDILAKLADPKVDPGTDPELALMSEREALIYILQVLAKRFG